MSFKNDLKVGHSGEEFIVSLHPDKLQQLDGRTGDIIILSSGELIEVKTDKRANSTGNIFLEHYSHKTKQTPGGPWQAAKNNCKYFLYLFFPCKSIYLYETQALIDYIIANEDDLRYHIVNSSKSNASGYITSIIAIRHLELKLEDILWIVKKENNIWLNIV